ncbi:unnamed protein product [Ilex paraguariensis]|uniref:U1-type domain-containing protein n=1 Tax=Ilex paraguariensis TaxID=185542 RepID=A0ABC8UYC2_9AQUA
MQQPNPNANPNPSHIEPYSHHLYTISHYPSYYNQLHPPNPNPILSPHQIHVPQYSNVGLDTATGPSGGYEAHQSGLAYTHLQTVDSALSVPSVYYHSATGVTITPNGAEQWVSANPNPTLWTNPTTQLQRGFSWKRVPKKTKVVQSVWCEICKIDCNSKDVLDNHKLGKKHKKNLEKLQAAPAPVSNNLIIGPQENPDNAKTSGEQKAKKKAVEAVEDLATKRRKLLEGGAAADGVRACALCNVVCNSETVFRHHLAGQKHAAMMKKYASGTGVSSTT